tara:strand:+ start:20575 stop:21549 length:975 start_codon:yes stop_codon:yes gene_type:complete
MPNRFSYKFKQFFFVLIKISLVVAAFYFMYLKSIKNSHLEFYDFILFLNKNDGFSFKNVFFLLFLTFFNWFFEILKWRKLVSSVKQVTFKNAIEQCLGSLTVSLFTPNRIGEYGAKAIYFVSSQRKRIMLINLISNLLQMGVTIILGLIGLIVFTQWHTINIDLNKLLMFLLISALLIGLISIIIKKHNLKIGGGSIQKTIQFFKHFPKKNLVVAALLSLLRYLIFSFQFYYVLTLFGIDINYLDAMMVITSMYLLASIIPSIFIFDVVIKGGIAVYLFSIIGIDELVTLSVVTLMWILNFVLPSILGSYYVLRFKFQTKNYYI